MCLKNPTKMNFLLEQSFKHIAFFSRNLPTPPGLPESMNGDSPSQSILLDDALESLCESFSREYYSWSKGLRPILTVIFFVIISKDLRGVNLLETDLPCLSSRERLSWKQSKLYCRWQIRYIFRGTRTKSSEKEAKRYSQQNSQALIERFSLDQFAAMAKIDAQITGNKSSDTNMR